MMNFTTPFDTQDTSNIARHDTGSSLARHDTGSSLARHDTGSNLSRRDTESGELSRRDSANVARRNTSEGDDNGMMIHGKNNVQMDSSKIIFKKVRENDTYLKLRRKTQHVGQIHSKTMKKMSDDRN